MTSFATLRPKNKRPGQNPKKKRTKREMRGDLYNRMLTPSAKNN